MRPSERISILDLLRRQGRLEGDESKNISFEHFGSYHLLDSINNQIQLVRHRAPFFARRQGAVRLFWCHEDPDSFVQEATFRIHTSNPSVLKAHELIVEGERMGLVEGVPQGIPILEYCASKPKESIFSLLGALAVLFDSLVREGVPLRWISESSILVHNDEIILTELGLWNLCPIPATMRWLLSEATRRSVPEHLVTWGQLAIRMLSIEGEGAGGTPLVFSLLKGGQEGEPSCLDLLRGLQHRELRPIFTPLPPMHVEGEREDVLRTALGTVLFVWSRIRDPSGDFFLLNTPLTQQQLIALEHPNPSHFSGAYHPAERLNLQDCMQICNRLSVLLGIEEGYRISKRGVHIVSDSVGVRLPSQSQWMRAAKAGEPYVFSGSINPKLCAWYEDNSNNQSAKVQQLQPNRFGLYDLSGNVWEWVHDPETGEGHGLGGSYRESYSGIELGAKLSVESQTKRSDLGFRPLIPIIW